MADINPAQLAKADEVLEKRSGHAGASLRRVARHDPERGPRGGDHRGAVVDPCRHHGGLPRRRQARAVREDDGVGRRRLRAHARGRDANNRILEIGYQRNYNPIYQAAYEGIVKAGVLGDVYLARLAWHRNGNWRRTGDPPVARLRSVEVGLPRPGTPPQLAALQAVLARPARRARQPPGEHRQLVLRRRRPRR